MKRQVMQPFRAPRKKNDKASPSRQSPRRQVLPESEESATELGLVWPLIIKETQAIRLLISYIIITLKFKSIKI